MLDGKVIFGAAIVMGATAQSWIQTANDYATLTLTVIGVLVGIATLWYTILRARKVRLELKKGKSDEHTKPDR